MTSRNLDNPKSITIAVATHKLYRMPTDPMYVPIEVGAALRANHLNNIIADNTGDNISERNPFYSELTALYWLWKNNNSDYKGIVHYRRHLGSTDVQRRHSKDPFDRLLSYDEALKLLNHADILVAKRRNYYIETIYSHYAHTFDAHQLDECRKIIATNYPKYLSAWDTVMASKTAHMFNMFIMRGGLFDKYCSWLFPILFELEKRIDPNQYDSFNARYLGRVSELMLDPWIITNGYRYTEVPVISPEPVNWLKKGSSFLMAKFFGKKYKKSF